MAADREQPSTPWADLSAREQAKLVEEHAVRTRQLGLAFLEKHPTDPRRWGIVDDFSPNRPRFVTEWRDLTNAIVDANAVAAWATKVRELKAAFDKATDIPEDVLERRPWAEYSRRFESAEEAHEKGGSVDMAALRAAVIEFAGKYPRGNGAFSLFITYVNLLQEVEPAKLPAEWEVFATNRVARISEFARRKLAFVELSRKPIELSFTAVDGTEVDLKKLRGKVVLVDFWATWCGPCVAELPNVVRAYRAYHDKGFEVVGVSLEMADVTPKDTAEAAAAKLSKARNNLIAFARKREITWPQYFDGKGWDCEVARPFVLSGIPAMFLLDQDGRIVSQNARGEELDREIRRLLKL